MNDAEISRRLALAIGWGDDPEDPDVAIFHTPVPGQHLKDYCAVWFERDWRTFDYRDPTVIWPVAERFDCFPERMRSGGLWAAPVFDAKANGRPPYPMLGWVYADTAAKAVALAVIKAHEGSKTA